MEIEPINDNTRMVEWGHRSKHNELGTNDLDIFKQKITLAKRAQKVYQTVEKAGLTRTLWQIRSQYSNGYKIAKNIYHNRTQPYNLISERNEVIKYMCPIREDYWVRKAKIPATEEEKLQTAGKKFIYGTGSRKHFIRSRKSGYKSGFRFPISGLQLSAVRIRFLNQSEIGKNYFWIKKWQTFGDLIVI